MKIFKTALALFCTFLIVPTYSAQVPITFGTSAEGDSLTRKQAWVATAANFDDLYALMLTKSDTTHAHNALELVFTPGSLLSATSVDGALKEVAQGINANETDIATNTASIAASNANVVANAVTGISNGSNIATNTADIASNVTAIANNSAGIATNLTNNALQGTNIATNATDIATNATTIASNTLVLTNKSDIAHSHDAVDLNFVSTATLTASTIRAALLELESEISAGGGFTGVTSGNSLEGDGAAGTPLEVALSANASNQLTIAADGLLSLAEVPVSYVFKGDLEVADYSVVNNYGSFTFNLATMAPTFDENKTFAVEDAVYVYPVVFGSNDAKNDWELKTDTSTGGISSVTSDGTLTGDGTAGTALSVNVSADANNAITISGTDGGLWVDGAGGGGGGPAYSDTGAANAGGYFDIGNMRIMWGLDTQALSGTRTVTMPAACSDATYLVQLTASGNLQRIGVDRATNKTTTTFETQAYAVNGAQATDNLNWQVICTIT